MKNNEIGWVELFSTKISTVTYSIDFNCQEEEFTVYEDGMKKFKTKSYIKAKECIVKIAYLSLFAKAPLEPIKPPDYKITIL